MSMIDLSRAFSLIEQHQDLADFDGPKPDELISQAENALGLPLPPTYKSFLKKYGCGSVAGKEFYGVIHNDFEASGIPDAIWLTLNERRMYQLPVKLILIYATGDGFYYALDSRQVNSDGEYSVVVWDPGAPKEAGIEKIYNDYGEFLYSQIDSALKD